MNARLYPLQLGGGLLLACIGAGLFASSILGLSYVIYGLACGVVAGAGCIFASRAAVVARGGAPTRVQVRVMYAAIALEVGAFVAVGTSGIADGWNAHTFWSFALAVVALHFLVMRFSHGPWVLWLGVAILLWLALSTTSHLRIEMIIAVDGLLKVAFGLIMASPLFTALATEAS
jgi:hypothetical protein